MPVELLRHITYSSQRQHFKRVFPSADLTHFIDSYVYIESIKWENCAALSDGVPTFVFLPHPDLSVTFVGEKSATLLSGGWFCGQYLKRVSINFHEPIDQLLVVRLQPDALKQFGVMTRKGFRREEAFQLAFLFGKDYRKLLLSMGSTNDIYEKVTFFEAFIRRHFKWDYQPNKLLKEALQCINIHAGKISIQEVAKTVGVNYKWLERTFRQYMGISPKEYARAQRILQTCNYLQKGDEDILAVALKSGYYDENHLLKDFKDFFGESPSSYRAGHKVLAV